MKHFNPDWSDFEIDKKVLDIPLYLPNPFKRRSENSIWVHKQSTREEICYKSTIKLNAPRDIVLVLRKSKAFENVNLKFYVSGSGEPVNSKEQSILHDFLAPPRVWMSDNLQERGMMYNAAKMAKGKILVGGLGLGLYFQFALFLNRPVNSITIIENNREIIDLIGNPLLKIYEDLDIKIDIVYDDVEKFMVSTKEKFDTIYLDTWGDLHIKFLPYINHMIHLSGKITTEKGMVYCWGYNQMYKDFQDLTLEIENTTTWEDVEIKDNLLLGEYMEWRKKLNQTPSKKNIIEKAKEIAINTKSDIPIELSIDLPRSKWMIP